MPEPKDSPIPILVLTDSVEQLASMRAALADKLAHFQPSYARSLEAAHGKLREIQPRLVICSERFAGSELVYVLDDMGLRASQVLVVLANRQQNDVDPHISRSCLDILTSAEIKGQYFVEALTRLLRASARAAETLQQRDAVAAAATRLREVYEETPSIFISVDMAGKISSINRWGAEQLGYQQEELVNRSLRELVSEADRGIADNCMAQARNNIGQPVQQELRLRCSDESPRWVRQTLRAVGNPADSVELLFACEDITETRKLSEQLSYHASHDSLTSLLNRREFDNRLKRVMESSREEDSEHALCYLDLDQFKQINDSCGHTAGDELLRQLGELLKRNVRKRDTLARLGGDEFGILMEHCTLHQARKVAENLRDKIEHFRFAWDNRVFNIGVSIGLVPIAASTGANSIEILKQADSACYAAKNGGRNRIHIYLEADTELARRHSEMQLIEQITDALESDRMELYAQAIVPLGMATDADTENAAHSTADTMSEHFEVLVRMRDDRGQAVATDAFLGAAERFGNSPRLDRWIIQSVFNRLEEYPERLATLQTCAINLSGLSLSNSDFHDFLLELLLSSPIPSEKICFEITETAAISNLTDAGEFITSVRKLGCKFALDDFGSGLSSFAYLKTLPVDYLKIDGFFVRDIAEDPISCAMVRSINDIGKLMGMQTVAEFVENDAIMEKLTEIGVDFAQGYGISRPQPLENFLTHS